MTHFGTTANIGTGADSADPDGDGSRNGGRFPVTVPAKPTRVYELQRSGMMNPATWTKVSEAGPGAGEGPVELSDNDPPGAAAFYRVRVSIP